MALSQTGDLEVFCTTCPTPEEVTTLLQGLGFRLIFQIATILYPAYTGLPPLPAQFHYRDEHGTEVVYLAGHDADMDGVRLPRHASRFWIFPGADLAVHRRVMQMLAVRWSLTWRCTIAQERLGVA
jgi:hypothetical protein